MSVPLLKVEQSLMQSRWVISAVNDDDVQKMMLHQGIPEIIARLLSARHIAPDAADSYLNPKLSRDFPDPLSLCGMSVCVADIADAIIQGKKIAGFCDFDVDGSTSAALLKKFFRHIGMDIPISIPDRLKDGYGPNIKSLAALRADGVDVVIMADCGTTAFDVIEQARALGLDICVLDHHEQAETLPVANHVINPKRKDDSSGLDMLAAVGVTFLTCVALNSELRARGYYAQHGLTEPPLKSWMDLVALGTVCDMVPLTGPNRLFVRQGFQQMAKGENAGLAALCAVGNIKKTPTAEDAGFILGPRINAGSRVHQSDLGAKLLSSEDPEEAKNLAWLLNDCNVKRRELQADMLRDAVRMVEEKKLYDLPLIMVGDESWHVGLNGLVAGQLKEKYGKPACVIAYAPGMMGALEGRGSGRSISGVNLAGLFLAAKDAGLLVKGGGHAMAAGFTVIPENIAPLYEFFIDRLAHLSDGSPLLAETVVDAVASIRGLKPDFVRMIDNNIGPFGQANAQPQFVLPYVRIIKADVVGENHVRCMVTDMEGGARIKAMAWKALDTDLGQALMNHAGRGIHLLGQFRVNEWNGTESVEFVVEDAAYALEKPVF